MRYSARVNSFIGTGRSVEGALRLIAGSGAVECVDLNYPEHFPGLDVGRMRDVLGQAGLELNSVAMRFRADYLRGEYTNVDPAVRRSALDLTKAGIDAAASLGCDLVTIWLGFDGFDYPFQKDYARAVDLTVEAFQELADHHPDMRLSIEYKPYEERVHALNSSLGMTLYLLERIDRLNVGATLDFCHMLMEGDMPSMGASLLLDRGKLWGVHLNDGDGRVDDGLMVGSVHPWETAEFLFHLLKGGYSSAVYFDTFPRREDPAEEIRANRSMVELLTAKLRRVGLEEISRVVGQEDGIAVQRLMRDLLS